MTLDELAFMRLVKVGHELQKESNKYNILILDAFLLFADTIHDRYLEVNDTHFDLCKWEVDDIEFDFNYWCLHSSDDSSLDTIDMQISRILMLWHYNRNSDKQLRVAYHFMGHLIIESYWHDGLNDEYPMYFLETFKMSDDIDDVLKRIHVKIQEMKEAKRAEIKASAEDGAERGNQ